MITTYIEQHTSTLDLKKAERKKEEKLLTPEKQLGKKKLS